MTYYMLATFADSFSNNPNQPPTAADDAPEVQWQGKNLTTASPEEIEALLSDTVLGEFKTRLGRIGLEYKSPPVPV